MDDFIPDHPDWARMASGSHLSERAGLYVLFSAGVALFSAVVLLLPYETVYVRDRAYLTVFLVTVMVCTAVFLLGTMWNALLWMRGKGLTTTPERRLLRVLVMAVRALLSKRLGRALAVLFRDALYLSKLKDRSALRWFMHLMILGGFLAMFALDLLVTFCLDIVKYAPMIEDDGWAKLWFRDFGFDLVGLMMLVGLTIAALRRFAFKPKIVRTELPDAASILFLLAVVLGGFVLEGMGIAGAIPGHESPPEYSFVGYAFSLLMPESFGQHYDQAWLVHGVMSALLIAYIPFSKLFHMLATPLAIEVEGLMTKEAGR